MTKYCISVRKKEMQEMKKINSIEKRVDRILELLEGKELATSVVLDGKEVAKVMLDQA